jgi:hypothetical protein
MPRIVVSLLLMQLVLLASLFGCNQGEVVSPTATPAVTQHPTTQTPSPTLTPSMIITFTEYGQKVTLYCYPENAVVGKLLEECEQFKAFYDAQRGKIARFGQIYWTQTSGLPEDIAAQCLSYTSQKGEIFGVIYLRHIPATLEDAIYVAHELQHFANQAEGFTGVVYLDKSYESLCTALGSMLDNQTVNSRLATYGFDMQKYYDGIVRFSYKQLGGELNPPSDYKLRMLWTFNYVHMILYWEDVLNMKEIGESEYQSWYDSRYPDIAKEGQALLTIVRSIGYDTPEKRTTLFGEIIAGYDLDKFCQQ